MGRVPSGWPELFSFKWMERGGRKVWSAVQPMSELIKMSKKVKIFNIKKVK